MYRYIFLSCTCISKTTDFYNYIGTCTYTCLFTCTCTFHMLYTGTCIFNTCLYKCTPSSVQNIA